MLSGLVLFVQFFGVCVVEFIVVRHGETDWNLAGRKQGHAGTNLNETGKKQAKEIAEKLGKEKIDAICSSDLPRALETAREINLFHNLEIQESGLLREIDLGKCNGMTSKEMREKFPEWGKLKDAEPETTPYPNGESHKDVQKRVQKFLKKITLGNNQIILVVSHQGFNRDLIQLLTGKPYAELKKMNFHHGIIYKFDTKTNKLNQIG